jgi:hypothetical protein
MTETVTGIYEGLDQIRKYKEEQAARKAAAEANRVNWLKLEEDETVRLWILQELDRGAENYHEECGIGLMATEHANPDNWRRKAVCTAGEDSQCLGCEKHKELGWKAGWKQKSRIYLNVLVERKDGTREVAVMSQANGPRSVIGPMILDLAVEENTITNRWYKLSKSGSEKESSYTFTPSMKESTDVDPTEYADQLNDLHKAVRLIPYEEQFDYYFAADQNSEQAQEKPAAAAPSWGSNAGSTDEEW